MEHIELMSLVIGLGISSDVVRAIGVQDKTVRWAVEADRSPDEPFAAALSALLARCPLPRRRRTPVVAAIGPANAQVKRLVGLPPLADSGMLAALVRQGASRFFLQADAALLTSGVRVVQPGVAWAAAFDSTVVDDVQRACQAMHLRLDAVVPTAVAMARSMADQEFTWRDGVIRMVVAHAAGEVESVRCLFDDAGELPAATPVAPLAVLGERAFTFADAYGATGVPRHEMLTLRVGPASDGAASRRQIALAAGACVLAATVALTAPTLVAIYNAHGTRAHLSMLATRDQQVRDAERELGRITSGLREVAAFQSSRYATTLLLRDFTRALPEGSAMITLQLDSTSGTLVALTPHAAGVVDALEKIDEISTPQIVGPVTREAIAPSGELERVTVHFRLRLGASFLAPSSESDGGA